MFVNQLRDDKLRQRYFQQDGASAHIALATIAYIQEHFDKKIINKKTNIPWPPRLPDITPLDFSVFGYIKDTVFMHRIKNLDELRLQSKNCCANIGEEMLQNILPG